MSAFNHEQLSQEEKVAGVNLTRAAGVCVIVAAMMMVGTLLVNPLMQLGMPARDAAGVWLLQFAGEAPSGYLYGWLGIGGILLSVPAIFALIKILARAGAWLWGAAAAMFAGVLFIVPFYVIELVVSYELAPRFVEGGSEVGTAVAELTNVLLNSGSLLLIVGSLLYFGVGIGLFSFIGRRLHQIPVWAGAAGFVAALLSLGWLVPILPVQWLPILNLVYLVEVMAGAIWMLGIGESLLQNATRSSC